MTNTGTMKNAKPPLSLTVILGGPGALAGLVWLAAVSNGDNILVDWELVAVGATLLLIAVCGVLDYVRTQLWLDQQR